MLDFKKKLKLQIIEDNCPTQATSFAQSVAIELNDLTVLLPKHSNPSVQFFNLKTDNFISACAKEEKLTVSILMSMLRSAINKRRPWETEECGLYEYFNFNLVLPKKKF